MRARIAGDAFEGLIHSVASAPPTENRIGRPHNLLILIGEQGVKATANSLGSVMAERFPDDEVTIERRVAIPGLRRAEAGRTALEPHLEAAGDGRHGVQVHDGAGDALVEQLPIERPARVRIRRPGNRH